jgi:hypothetical protein
LPSPGISQQPQANLNGSYPTPPISKWPEAKQVSFKNFLRQLEALGLSGSLEGWTSISTVHGRLNFYYPMGNIKSEFLGWFFHFYTMQGTQFSNWIWQVLMENDPNSRSILDTIG